MLVISSKNIDYDFSSTQFDIPKNIAAELKAWTKENVDVDDIYVSEETPGLEDEIHVTVKFGLHTEDPEVVRKVVEGFGSFDITLGKVSRFANPDKPFDVVKVEVQGDDLHELNSLISDKLENTDSFPEYKPHITLAYVKKGTNRELSGGDILSDKKIRVNEITFSAKNGEKTKITL